MSGGVVHGRQQAVKLDDLAGALTAIPNGYLTNAAGLMGKADRPETSGFGDVRNRHAVLGLLDGGPVQLSGWFVAPPTPGGTAVKTHGRKTAVLLAQYALTGYLTACSIKRALSIGQSPAFGSAWMPRGIVGRVAGTISLQGNFDAVATGPHTALSAALQAETLPMLSVATSAAGFAVGAVVECCRAGGTTHQVSGDSGGNSPVAISGEFVADDGIELGVSLHALTAETATMNGTSVDEGAASGAADGGVAYLHVTALTGTSFTFVVQDSANGTDWTDMTGGSFGAVTAAGSYRVAITGTPKRYVRISITAAAAPTTVTFQATFCRRNFTYGAAGTYRHMVGLITRTGTAGAAPASASLEYGPEGSGSGSLKYSCEVRPSSLDLQISVTAANKFSMSLEVDGTVTVGTFS